MPVHTLPLPLRIPTLSTPVVFATDCLKSDGLVTHMGHVKALGNHCVLLELLTHNAVAIRVLRVACGSGGRSIISSNIIISGSDGQQQQWQEKLRRWQQQQRWQ